MIKLLTPQEALQAMLDGKDVEYRHIDSSEWLKIERTRPSVTVLVDKSYEFRLPQEMVTIGDVSFPKPYQGEVEYDEVYYFPTVDFKSLYDSTRWSDDPTDNMLMIRGLVHLTKDNAIAHAKALIKLSGGDV